MAEPRVSVGARVQLHGLQARPELNGCQGVVVEYYPSKSRFGVRLDGPGSEPVSIAERCLTLIEPAPETDESYDAQLQEALRMSIEQKTASDAEPAQERTGIADLWVVADGILTNGAPARAAGFVDAETLSLKFLGGVPDMVFIAADHLKPDDVAAILPGGDPDAERDITAWATSGCFDSQNTAMRQKACQYLLNSLAITASFLYALGNQRSVRRGLGEQLGSSQSSLWEMVSSAVMQTTAQCSSATGCEVVSFKVEYLTQEQAYEWYTRSIESKFGHERAVAMAQGQMQSNLAMQQQQQGLFSLAVKASDCFPVTLGHIPGDLSRVDFRGLCQALGLYDAHSIRVDIAQDATQVMITDYFTTATKDAAGRLVDNTSGRVMVDPNTPMPVGDLGLHGVVVHPDVNPGDVPPEIVTHLANSQQADPAAKP